MVVCENCAGEDEELAPVWPTEAKTAEQPQLWCSDCRGRYGHEPAEDDDSA